MTRENAIDMLLDYFDVNEESFTEVIEDLDSWNGYLGDDRWYYMEELDDLYTGAGQGALEVLRRAFFGYDLDYSTEDRREAFNPNRDYFKFNGYGNLVSSDYRDYSDLLDNYFVNEVIDNAGRLELPAEVVDIINAIDD